MKGVDLKTVSELLGHSTTRMTERYSHLSPAHKLLAINLLPSEPKARTGQSPEEVASEGSDCYDITTLRRTARSKNEKPLQKPI